MATLTNETLALSKSAFEAEHSKNFENALKLHRSAIAELEKSTHDGKLLRTDAVRLAKMQMKVHKLRCDLIQAALATKREPSSMLPTINSALDQFKEYTTSGKTHIGFESQILNEWKNNQERPHPEPPAEVAHLVDNTPPFYTPTLDPNLPTKSFYIDYSTELTAKNGGCWVYYKVKEAPGGGDIYSMQTLTKKGVQNTTALFYRAADLFNPALEVHVQPLPNRPDIITAVLKGRPITISGPSGSMHQSPDRIGKTGWTPRRFEFAERKFVWKQEGGVASSLKETLWEVEKVWPKPGSKTGKREDKTLERKLVWTERPTLFNKYYILHMVGGIDQIFQEYLLATHMAREMIEFQTS